MLISLLELRTRRILEATDALCKGRQRWQRAIVPDPEGFAGAQGRAAGTPLLRVGVEERLDAAARTLNQRLLAAAALRSLPWLSPDRHDTIRLAPETEGIEVPPPRFGADFRGDHPDERAALPIDGSFWRSLRNDPLGVRDAWTLLASTLGDVPAADPTNARAVAALALVPAGSIWPEAWSVGAFQPAREWAREVLAGTWRHLLGGEPWAVVLAEALAVEQLGPVEAPRELAASLRGERGWRDRLTPPSRAPESWAGWADDLPEGLLEEGWRRAIHDELAEAVWKAFTRAETAIETSEPGHLWMVGEEGSDERLWNLAAKFEGDAHARLTRRHKDESGRLKGRRRRQAGAAYWARAGVGLAFETWALSLLEDARARLEVFVAPEARVLEEFERDAAIALTAAGWQEPAAGADLPAAAETVGDVPADDGAEAPAVQEAASGDADWPPLEDLEPGVAEGAPAAPAEPEDGLEDLEPIEDIPATTDPATRPGTDVAAAEEPGTEVSEDDPQPPDAPVPAPAVEADPETAAGETPAVAADSAAGAATQASDVPAVATSGGGIPAAETNAGHLFVDVKGFTALAANLKEVEVRQVLRSRFYGPLLGLAHDYFRGGTDLADRGGIRLNNLLGDALSLSGEIADLLEFSERATVLVRDEAGGLLGRRSGAAALAAYEQERERIDQEVSALRVAKARGEGDPDALMARIAELQATLDGLAPRNDVVDVDFGCFVAWGAPPIELEIEDPVFGHVRVALAEKLNESARGCERAAEVEAALSAFRRAHDGRPLAFHVHVGPRLVGLFPEDLLDAWPETPDDADAVARSYPAAHRFSGGTALCNTGIALSGEAARALTAGTERHAWRGRSRDLTDILGQHLAVEPRQWLVTAEGRDGSSRLLRYCGRVQMKGFDKPPPVWEWLGPWLPFFDPLHEWVRREGRAGEQQDFG